MTTYLLELGSMLGPLFVTLAPVFYIISVMNVLEIWRCKAEVRRELARAHQNLDMAKMERLLTEQCVDKHQRVMKEFAGLWHLGMQDDAVQVLVDAGHKVVDERPRKQHG